MIKLRVFILCLFFLPTTAFAQEGPSTCAKLLRTTLNIINYPQVFEVIDAGLTRRNHRNKALKQIRLAEQVEPISEESIPSLYAGPVRDKDWDYSKVIVHKKVFWGDSKISEYDINEFAQVLLADAPDEIKDFIPQIINALIDIDSMDAWISDLRKELVGKMLEDGVLNTTSIDQPEIVEYYLDQILAYRASARGFLLNDDGTSKDILTTSAGNFFRGTLAYGYFFTDWTGATLRHPGSDIIHSVRGHSLQIAFLAEHVPNFVDFIKLIGRTKDSANIFYRLLDNGHSPKTAFHPGGMVDVYGKYLGITE